MRPGARSLALSLAAGVAVFLAANGVESALVRLVHGSEHDLEWISDLVLAAAFAAAVYLSLRLKAARGQLSQLERAQIAIDTEMAIAADVQRKLLPEVPDRPDGVRWAALMEPAGRVGGDFYHFAEQGSDALMVAVGDVSGKGVPAALVLAATHALLRMIASESDDPAQIVTRLSRALFEENGGSPYLTCIVARFDRRPRTFSYVNAGHPPGVIVGRSGRRLLESTGPPAGMFPSLTYRADTVAIEPGSAGVLVTDGITEALELNGGSAADRIAAFLEELGASAHPARICQALMSLAAVPVEREPALLAPQDDRTVLAFVADEDPGAAAASDAAASRGR